MKKKKEVETIDIEKLWEKNTNEARTIMRSKVYSQMAIADLALEVCEITWGGPSADKYTLTRFAREAQINHKTLSTWVAIKKNVYDKLDSELKSKATYTDICTVSRFVSSKTKPIEVIEKLRSHIGMDRDDAKLLRYCKNMRAIAHNFESGHAFKVKKTTLEEIYFYCRMIMDNIEHNGGVTKGIDHGLAAKYSLNKQSAARAMESKLGSVPKSGYIQDDDGFRVKISDKDMQILSYLKKHKTKYHAPTTLGMELGKHKENSASAWAYRTLNKMVAVGYVERNQHGHYKYVYRKGKKAK